MKWLLLTLFLLAATPVSAQTRFAWQQENEVNNPQTLLYRVYLDVGPYILVEVACIGPATGTLTWDCVGRLPTPVAWATAYATAENSFGESLASNVIVFDLPLPAIPSSPRNFRVVQ